MSEIESDVPSRYTFRVMGGYFDAQSVFWSTPGTTPDAPCR
jgi:hypothetical protein